MNALPFVNFLGRNGNHSRSGVVAALKRYAFLGFFRRFALQTVNPASYRAVAFAVSGMVLYVWQK